MHKVKLVETMEGEGATVKRLMPVSGLRNFDPFVLMDHFTLQKGMGFPTHPHRGFEGITYLFSGSMNHKDNLGNDETILAGGAQRFTAGKGMEHSEMPSDTEVTDGIQLWINLPQSKKQLAPSYQQVLSEEIPTTQNNGLQRQPLVGKDGVINIQEDILYEVLTLDKDASTVLENKNEQNMIVYLVDGDVNANGEIVVTGEALLIEENISLNIKANKTSKIILLAGKPIGEPIYQHGPYVD